MLHLYFKPSKSNRSMFFLNWDSLHEGWIATMRHGVTKKRITKRLKHKRNLFINNLVRKYSSWWRRLEEVLKTSFIFVFSRHLQEDEDEDILIKTNIFILVIYLQKMSSRRLQDVFVKTLVIPLQEIFKTFLRRLAKASLKRFQDIFKTSCKDVLNTFSRRIIKLNSSC